MLELARRHGVRLETVECNALVGTIGAIEGVEGVVPTLLALPQTYMNRSGYAARCLVERHGFEPQQILAVFDEIHLPLGRLRLRRGGSPGGHRGMESILENLRSAEVPRLRLGVGRAVPEGEEPEGEEGLADFVLSPFAPEEREAVDEMILRAADACEAWLREGIEMAMNKVNRS